MPTTRMTAMALCGVLPFFAACRGTCDHVTPAGLSKAAVTTPAADIEAEFRRCMEEWREESRWAEFLSAYSRDPRWSVRPTDPKESAAFMALWDDMCSLAFDSFGGWYIMRRAEFVGDPDAVAKQEFIDRWKQKGPAIREKRIRVVIAIARDVWKAENADILENLEHEFPRK